MTVRTRGRWTEAAVERCSAPTINHNDGGRGVYFMDPAGHATELITVPYGGRPGHPHRAALARRARPLRGVRTLPLVLVGDE